MTRTELCVAMCEGVPEAWMQNFIEARRLQQAAPLHEIMQRWVDKAQSSTEAVDHLQDALFNLTDNIWRVYQAQTPEALAKANSDLAGSLAVITMFKAASC